MKQKNIFPMLSLQLFADGGAAAAGAAAGDSGTAQGAGVTETAAGSQKAEKVPLSEVKYGIQQEENAPAAEVQQKPTATPEVVDRNAEFEKLIKGEYKDLYDAKMQDTIRKRLKGQMQTVERYNALAPVLEILGRKYGIDPTDSEALSKAIEADDSYLQEEALAQGVSVEQLRKLRTMERENASLRRQMSEQTARENANRQYNAWLQQAEDVKKVYPSFDMQKEMGNSTFVDLLRSNIDVRTAYEVVHKDEIIPAAMQFAARTVEQKLANDIMAGGARPTENGMSAQSAAVTKSDVSQLSKEDIAEISRRVARGEKISFG